MVRDILILVHFLLLGGCLLSRIEQRTRNFRRNKRLESPCEGSKSGRVKKTDEGFELKRVYLVSVMHHVEGF